MKKVIALIAIFAVAMSGMAFAAVENIKVSGDFSVFGVDRHGYDLGSATEVNSDDISVLASVTNLRFDADLTEDVMFTAVITDERAWGVPYASGYDEIYLSSAYATLKDVLSYPVTLKIGKQPVLLGSGLVVADADTDRVGAGVLGTGSNGLGDLSPRKTFDAIVGVIDLDPATLTVGMIKANEGQAGIKDDTTAYLVNLGYNFEDYNTMGEVYWVKKDDSEKVAAASKADIDVYGVRTVSTVFDNLTLIGEFAYQVQQDYRSDGRNASDRAFQVAANYAFMDAAYAPTIGIDYSYISENWNVMYEGWSPARIANVLFPNSDCAVYGLTVTAEPREDMSLSLRYAYLELAEKLGSTAYSTDYATYVVKADEKGLGSEIDLTLTYDYTEDVQFGLCTDFFIPGDFFDSTNDKDAIQVLGSMKVSF